MKRTITLTLFLISVTYSFAVADENPPSWVVDSQADWEKATAEKQGINVSEGAVSPTGKTGSFKSTMKIFPEKRSVSSVTLTQSPIWQNWNPINNLGPQNLNDAPVLLTMGPDNYWMFGKYGGGRKGKKNKKAHKKPADFVAQKATLEGFDIPLMTTKFSNQYNAPGGLKPSKGGYHAWQSRDMKNWVHHGPVTESFSKWVTSAEMIGDKVLIYYDFPNDQDPHVYVDSDLTDGEPGENKGMAVKDPSHGSDAGFIRGLDGRMHCIIEDWSPISANKRSWDSPLAGHFVSPDGISGFVEQKPAVDNRTKPTGKIGTYKHPHWVKEDPKNYKTSVAEYNIHKPEQEAYGDWAAISIGGQYYLFGDYDPAGGHEMSVGWFTSSSIDEPFTWCDNIGKGHPDPDVCFAEGRFYLATQQSTDYTSPGPWVEKAEVRVGVDTDNDGKTDKWTDWQQVKESYDYIKGFSKQIKKTPASLDLSSLPEGYGFQFEIKLTDTTENKSKPILESVELKFKSK
ncbi:MAG: hypothetical protein AB8F34_05995 [Akkermansiaceae bacterium]